MILQEVAEQAAEAAKDADLTAWELFIDYLDKIGIVLGVLALVIPPFIRWVILPTIRLYKNQNKLLKLVDEIKKEVTPNGGSSIKDSINRIEKRQIMIDKRSKAVFYTFKDPIFEVDERGNILWANQAFHTAMGTKNLKGLDWVSFIDELHREHFLRELESCSDRLRELKFETTSTEGKNIKFSGYPYRDNDKNFGFLIYLEGV